MSRPTVHLINAALNVPGSPHPGLRGRDADLFLFSKHFCGSALTGWYPTRDWQAADSNLDPGTAMAISGAAAEYWLLNPTLVVESLAGGAQTPGIPELGNTTAVRWSDDIPTQEEQIVTTVLRDVVLAAFHRTLGRTMPDEPSHIVLNWLPDPISLLHIPRIRKAQERLRVYYPGRGLTGLELDTLNDYFPEIDFLSFDRDTP